jgi:hypothetical protein
VQTSEISKLILEYSFRILHIDESGLMRLQFDHMPYMPVFLFHIVDECNGGRRARLCKFKHFEHPVGNIAQTLLSNEL